MISAWELYLWTRLDSLSWFFTVVPIIFGIVYGIKLLSALTNKDVYFGSSHVEGKEKYALACAFFTSKRIQSVPFIIGIIFFMSILIPSKKDMAIIWIVPQLATVENAELLQGEAAEIYKLAKDALTEEIKPEPVD